MDTHLLAWNPKRWNWARLKDDCAAVARGGAARQRWSCGTITGIKPGGRFFLIRLGEDPKGIMGSGRIVSTPYRDSHWDATKGVGETALFVQIDFESLADEPLIGWDELHNPPLAGFHWGTQMSGIRIPSPFAEELERVWKIVSPVKEIAIPEEITRGHVFYEGSAKSIQVNTYERDPKARAAIASFGCAFPGMIEL